jgi:hypothetical protein
VLDGLIESSTRMGRRGLLVFKGEDSKPKKRKSRTKLHLGASPQDHHSVHRHSTTTCRDITSSIDLPPQEQQHLEKQESKPSLSAAAPAAKKISQLPSILAAASASRDVVEKSTPQLQDGTGTITTSGTVVTGYDTRFTRELSVGDALIVALLGQQRGDGAKPQLEMRVITMRLSDVSLNLSSAFSQSIARPTSFQFIRKPRDQVKEVRLAEERALQNAKNEEQLAFGTYGSGSGGGTNGDELVYREKTEHGSYRIKREQVQGMDLTRGNLLQMRTKKKSDKYC